jgi:Zn-dependent peptidase ImmA (M78 family)
MMSQEWRAIDGNVRGSIEKHQVDAPIKLSEIAKTIGVKVISTPLPSGISGEIRPDPEIAGGFVIRVNRNDSARRQRFTVAHEIGHFLLHRDQIGNGITDDVLYRSTMSDWREAQANRIAADILMPQALVDEWLERAKLLQVDDVVGFLSDKFNVSGAAMKIRLGLS